MTSGVGRAETIRPGLERIREALELSGHPERSFRAVHIAGTNGKGSVSCFVEAILSPLLPNPVGLFTSPHLLSPEERIRTGGNRIPGDAFRRGWRRAEAVSRDVVRRVGEPLSYFETMTWVACDWFRKQHVGLAVMETGLGGRWDATNACHPVVSVVTTVGMDHREWLGETLGAIAAEKSGIFRAGVPAVLGRIRPAARAVVVREARRIGCPVWELGRDFGWRDGARGRIEFRLPGMAIGGARVGMAGEFQKDNAAVACAAAWRALAETGVTAKAFARAAAAGTASAVWPGRFAPLPGTRNAGIWTDGAHNPDAARALADELLRMREQEGVRRLIVVWTMLGDKDIRGFVRELAGSVDGWVAYPLGHDRAADGEALATALEKSGLAFDRADDFDGALRKARRWAGTDGRVLVCGSLFAVADAFRSRLGRIP